MTTFTLMIFLTYSAGNADIGTSAAMISERLDFFGRVQCEAAKKAISAELKSDGFKRFSLTCVDREMPVEGGPFPGKVKK
jgi:hypothetical protein